MKRRILGLTIALTVATIGLPSTSVKAAPRWEPLGQVISGDANNLEAGKPVLSGDGRTLAIPAIYSDVARGHVDVYSLVNGQWVRKGLRLVGSDSVDQFGSDVALDYDGNVLAVGANLADGAGNSTNAAGEVTVYDYDSVNNVWTQRGTTIYGDSTLNSLGDRVRLDADGQRLLASASFNDDAGPNRGKVLVFEWFNNNWIQVGNSPAGSSDNDWYGSEVDLSDDGERMIVGVRNRNLVEIRVLNAGVWQLEATFNPNGVIFFGWTVAIDGTGSTAVVSSFVNPNVSKLTILRRSGSSWTVDDQLTIPDEVKAAQISADGRTIAFSTNGVGEPLKVLRFEAGAWSPIGSDIAPPSQLLRFEQYLSLSGDGSTVAGGSFSSYGGFTTNGWVATFRLVEPIVVPIRQVSLDPNGGRCTDGTVEHDSSWLSIYVVYRYLPASSDCSRSGYVFDGWADRSNPSAAKDLPLLTDPLDGTLRYFVAEDVDLIAIWTALPRAITDLTVFANFFCGPCTNAWLLFTTPSNATDFTVAVNGTVSSCAQKGTYFGLSLCELTRLTPGPTTFAVTPLKGTGRGPTASTVVTLRK